MLLRAFSLIVIGLVVAQITGCKGSTKRAKDNRAHGSIKAIDVAARTIVLAEKQSDPGIQDTAKVRRTFRVATDCKISIPGKGLADLSELKVGDHINIKYSKEGGQMVAHLIYPHMNALEPASATK